MGESTIASCAFDGGNCGFDEDAAAGSVPEVKIRIKNEDT